MPKRKNGGKTRLQRVHSGGPVAWLNVLEPTKASLAELKALYPFFLDDDLNDCLPPFQRPKLLQRGEYLFMVLIFPVYEEKTGVIHPYEVDFFVGKDFLVTSHRGTHPTMTSLSEACGEGSESCVIRPNDNPLRLTLDIIHGLTVSCYPMVTELSNDLIETEQALFDESGNGEVTKTMLRLRTNVVAFRKAMQGSDSALRKLLARGSNLFPVEEFRPQVDDINGHSREIREFLDNDRETADALYDAHLSLVSYRTNQATQALTALALIIFPMNLVAAIFSMRAEHMPFLGHPADFWIMVGAVLATMLIVVSYLRGKKWL